MRILLERFIRFGGFLPQTGKNSPNFLVFLPPSLREESLA
jgi:hypothetical protein